MAQRKHIIRPKDLASQLKVTERYIRRILRAMPIYNDGVYTKYEWSDKDPLLPIISTAVKSRSKTKSGTYESVITSKGQLVIPAEIRRRYHIQRGTQIRFEELDKGILLRPVTAESIKQVRGILAGKGLPERIEKEPDRDIR